MPPTTLQVSTDYRPALLWLMSELGSARSAEVIVEFERRLGNLIPPEHRQTNNSGSIKWEHYVRWARQHLYGSGLMGSGGRGIWTITEAGRDWLRDHPDGGKKELLALKAPSQGKTPASTLRSFRWRGQLWQVDTEKLLKQARELLAQGPPPEAMRYRDWAVYIDDQPVSAKWLFHLITNVGYSDFDSPTARRLLKTIGLEAQSIGNQGMGPLSNPPKITRQNKAALRNEFFKLVADRLGQKLNNLVSHGKITFFLGKNWLQVSYPEFPRSHYELRLARGFDEVAFHFEGNKDKNLTRLAHVQPQTEHLSQVLGHPVVAVPWGTRWARLAIEFKPALWTAAQAQTYADLMAKFIAETFSILRPAFDATSARRRRAASTTYDGDDKEAHTVLDQQITQIREYLRGRAAPPSDELLCEWVHFCYSFQLFQEGAEIFNLINPADVDSWPYERAKRLARVCQMRAKSA